MRSHHNMELADNGIVSGPECDVARLIEFSARRELNAGTEN